MPSKQHSGFTLMELLIVLVIIVALLAMLIPGVIAMRGRWLVRQAEIKIRTIQGALQEYALANKGYPTNEQGLYALVFIPDNFGVVPMVPQAGMPGATDPSLLGGMGGGSVAAGPEMMMNPAANQMGMTPGAPLTGTTPGTVPGMTDTMAMGTTGAATPGMVTDPTGMGMGGGMMAGGAMTGAWVQPTYNPQLYMQQRRRPESTAYVGNESELIDPWGSPYRYDNSLQYYGVNLTGSTDPAVWSAGPDKTDNTDDDVRSWDLLAAQQKLALRQSQGTMGSGTMGMGGMTANPMQGMPMQQPGMMGTDPMTGAPMTQPNPMATPMQGGLQTPAGGGMTPMQPNPMATPMQGGLQTPAGGGMTPMQPNPMANPMPGGMQTPMQPNPMIQPMAPQPGVPTGM